MFDASEMLCLIKMEAKAESRIAAKAKKKGEYRLKATRCNCHPETCCCSPWQLFDPDGKYVSSFDNKKNGKKIVKKLNKN